MEVDNMAWHWGGYCIDGGMTRNMIYHNDK